MRDVPHGPGEGRLYYRKVQIVVVTTWFPTDRHVGAGTFIRRDVEALAKDHDVRVVHLVPPELDDGVRSASRDGYDLIAVGLDVRTPAGLWAATRQMKALTLGADVVHTMAAPALLPFLLRRPDMPWIHTEHWSGVANLVTSPRARLALPLSRRAFTRPDRMVAVSDYLATSIRRLRRSDDVDVIGNIIDMEFGDIGSSRVATGTVDVLGVGTVNEHKGWRIAVDAVYRLRARGVDARLLWLGQGPEYDRLADRARAGFITAPGQVSMSRVRQAMAGADVLVLPTRSETFSLVTVEALVQGTPVVATGRGAHAEFLTPGSGLLVERTAAAVADAIEVAASFDRVVARKRGQELSDRFAETEFRRQYSTIYREVTAQ